MIKQNVYNNNCLYKKVIIYTGKFAAASILLILSLLPFSGFSQQDTDYDEIAVFFNVQRFGGTELTAVIKEENVFLPVTDVFKFLKIRNVISKNLDSISGFFINQESVYLIDKTHNQIVFQGKTFPVKKGDLIGTESSVYLKSTYFGEVFGLDCAFSFRSLSVTLTTKLELPVIREMRQEQMRANINRLKGEVKADTTVGRSYPFFSLGMADWSVIATQQLKGKSDARVNFTLGSVLAGGEADVSINYNKNAPFNEKEQYYLWRFVNNDHRALRQTMVGKIGTQATSSIFNPVVGVQFTNTPSTYRRSFGTYTLSDVTEPNWMVELYVNSVMVDYVKADASGFFKFEVPMVYGNSAVMLRFYGPWGEEKTREVNISIPFNFLPPKEFEYSVSAGMVEDSLFSRFSRTSVNYGLTSHVTVGGGFEYLSSITTGPAMPFLSSSVRLGSSLLLSGDYMHNVRFKGLMSYRLPSNLQFEVDYSHYTKGQKAIFNNYLEERKAVISVPVKSQNFSAYSRLTLNQLVMQSNKNTSAELLLSGALYGISTNFTTYGMFTDPSNPYVYSNLSLALRFPRRLVLTPQIQYEYMTNEVISTKANLEKSIFTHGFFNFSYEHFRNNVNSFELGLRYDLPFAQTGFSARQSGEMTSMVESARGSFLYDVKNNFVSATNRSSVGKGAITFIPFLDLNCNGRRDADEPKIPGLNLRIDGGRMEISERDTTIRIVDLIPYTNYFVEFNKNSFDNISWQIKKLSMLINVDANRFKTIEIPVAVMGEVSGTIYEKGKMGKTGLGRILINFYRNDTLVTRAMSEADGYFSLLGLAPGPYTVRIDTMQLRKIHMAVIPLTLPVVVKRSVNGDVIDGLEFTLVSTQIPEVENKIQPSGKDSLNEVNPAVLRKTEEGAANTGKKSESSLTVDSSKKAVKEIIKTDSTVKTGVTTVDGSKKPDSSKKAVKEIIKTDSTVKTGVTTMDSSKKPDGGKKAVTEAPVNGGLKTDSTGKGKGLKKEIIPMKADTGKVASIIRKSGKPVTLGNDSAAVRSGKTVQPLPVMIQGMTEIQVGAFTKKSNAEAILKKIEHAISRKCVIIFEDGLYKVRITGYKDRIEAESRLAEILKLGFEESFVVGYHKGIVIQVDAFIFKLNALSVQRKLMNSTGRRIKIVEEDGFYKIRIEGFSGRKDAEEFLPSLIRKGYPEAFIVRDSSPLE